MEEIQIKFYKIKKYPNYYISKCGSIYSKNIDLILIQNKNNRGYPRIRLFNDKKYQDLLISRLVAETFIPNPKNKPQVNHIDGNPMNNHIDNLEWNTKSENMKHSFRVLNRKHAKPMLGKIGKLSPHAKKIGQYNKQDNKLIKEWDCIKEAAEQLNIKLAGISHVCRGVRKSAGGYIWKFL